MNWIYRFISNCHISLIKYRLIAIKSPEISNSPFNQSNFVQSHQLNFQIIGTTIILYLLILSDYAYAIDVTVLDGESRLGSAGVDGDLDMGTSGGDGESGIYNLVPVGTLSNAGIILGGNGGIGFPGGSGGPGINNLNTITTLNNIGSGIISGGNGAGDLTGIGNGAAGGSGILNNTNGTIEILSNSWRIIGGAGGLGGASGGVGGTGGDGINNKGIITTLNNTNTATIEAGSGGGDGNGFVGGVGGIGINNSGTIASITNSGSIKGGSGGTGHTGSGGAAGNGGTGIYNFGALSSLSNSGSILGGVGGNANIDSSIGGAGGTGIINFTSRTIDTLTNSGSITGGAGGAGSNTQGGEPGFDGGAGGDGINNSGTITSLTNTGNIKGGNGGTGGTDLVSSNNGNNGSSGFGINNYGTIVTLNNLQGEGNLSGPLNYKGELPTNYNIIIAGQTQYGRLSVSSATGSTTFGISSLSGANIGTAGTRYQNVLSGVAASLITNEDTNLTYVDGSNTWTYKLVTDDGNVSGTWDLSILSMLTALSGPSSIDTQSSLRSLASKLRGAFSGQTVATNFANMNTYDCNLFDSRGFCISVGGQQTYIDNSSTNMTSSVVVAGYKISPTIRIGGFLNQNLNNHTSSSVDISNANPLMGLFAVWNQNESYLGYQIKIANAYQNKDVNTTRDVIGTSEAGRGKTELNTQSYVGELSYAYLMNKEKTLVRPYLAVRYTRIKQDAYREDTGIQNPLSYSALSDRSTVALAGIKLNHKFTESVTLTGSVGVEQDLSHHVDNLNASGVSGLTSENFNDNIKRTRPVASFGAQFTPLRNHRIAGEIFYQQLPFQSTASVTAYVDYAIGF